MSEKYKFRNPEGIYFTTITIVYWIDLFTRRELKEVILDSLKHCQNEKGLDIYAWCLMPSHLHMIIGSDTGNLSDIMRDFKKHTSKKLVNEISLINESRKDWLLAAFSKAGKELKRIKNNKVWKDGNHPKELETNYFMDQKLKYIHENPVLAGIVEQAEHYLYSSARDYCGYPGLLKIKLLE
tara:strand:- start:1195 stop:1740 length:546 start_codon:yes stop_codon:yes gene_type:complete